MTHAPHDRAAVRRTRRDATASHAGLRAGPGARPRACLVAAVLGAALALGGCADLRLETPPPPTPSPDAVEQVRDRTARDAVDLADLATRAALTAPEAVAPLLGRVAEVSLAHADALGGVYEPFPDATAQPTPAPAAPDVGAGATVAPSPTQGPADAPAVLAALSEAAATARVDADAVADGDLGRLLAAVWVSRALLAESLGTAVAAAGGSPDPTASATPAPPAVPEQVPPGVELAEVLALVQSEDAAGLAWEVVAARSSDAARADAAARAALHRERAEAWAVAAGVARGDEDPRRAAYDLPEALTVDGATAESMLGVTTQVEASLGVTYASLVARADAGGRGALLDAMLDQVPRGLAAGAPVPAFPGLPERA